MIKLRDRDILVQYLQIVLKESSFSRGILVKENLQGDKEVSYLLDHELRVTSTYDKDTYVCLADYMAKLYPNEGFPYVYSISDEPDPDTGKYYLINRDFIPTSESIDEELEVVINNNLTLSNRYPEVLNIPDRVLAYILDSVVTIASNEDEVYEIQKLLLEKGIISSISYPGDYDSIEDTIKDFQDKNKLKVTGYFDPITEKVVSGR